MAIEHLKKIAKKLLSPRYFPSLISLVIILISFFSVKGLVASDVVLVKRDEITLRAKPGTNEKSVKKINKGEKIAIIDQENGWQKIRLNDGTVGWVPKWLNESDELDDDQNLAGLATKNTPIYLDPNTDSQVLIEIEANQHVDVNYENNGWAQVQYKDQLGYVQTQNINLVNREDVIEITDPHGELAGEAEEDEIVIVRRDGEAFHSEPDYFSPPIYNPVSGDEFTYIETVYDDNGTEFYKVSDQRGNTGYLETRIVSLASDSADHVPGPTVDSLIGATIVLDPGHGGVDAGAVSMDGEIYEKTINMDTVLAIKDELEKAGAKVILTREGDYMLDLAEIADISNKNEADAFISVHYDSINDPSMSGVTTYYFHEDDLNLARAISQELDNNGPDNNGISYGNLQVLRSNKRPALLLELGCLSNEADLKIIRKDKYYQDVAKSIVDGLIKYFSNDPSLTP